MRNFYCLGGGLITKPLVHELMVRPELWNMDKYRTEHEGTPHNQVEDIWLRYSHPDNWLDDVHPQWYPAWQVLQVHARGLILNVFGAAGGYELGRAFITRLHPGGEILAHVDDQGEYHNQLEKQRYHIVLQGLPGSVFRCGNETVQMQTGEVWWFDSHTEHSVVNNSEDDRIHMIVDLKLFPAF